MGIAIPQYITILFRLSLHPNLGWTALQNKEFHLNSTPFQDSRYTFPDIQDLARY